MITLTRGQKLRELLLSVPWLVLAVSLFSAKFHMLGFSASFFFFLTGLRQAHGAQHSSLGLPRLAQDCLLAVLSVLLLASLHALQATHMHHHRHALEDSDVESATARLSWWRAILQGPWFIVMLHWEGFRLAKPSKRKWVHAEVAAIVIYLLGVAIWGPTWLRWFAAAMLLGECLTGFFAVWTVHHDCDPQHQLARTQRGWWKTALTYQMFYHVEHHLYPAVPTPRLPELAARLDASIPMLQKQQVF